MMVVIVFANSLHSIYQFKEHYSEPYYFSHVIE